MPKQKKGRAPSASSIPAGAKPAGKRASGVEPVSAPGVAPSEGNFVSYVQTQLDTLDARPLGAVDSLVLSWISYFRLREDAACYAGFCSWEGLPVTELLRAEDFGVMFGDSWDPEGSRDLLFAVCANPRFRGMRVCGYRTSFSELAEEQFAAMKPTAFFLNAARGDVVDEPAMVEALKNGVIAGAGLDVLVEEPMPGDHPLMSMPNVTITPHMAAQTQETTAKLVTMAAEGTLAVLRGEKWPHVANPEVYNHPKWADR